MVAKPCEQFRYSERKVNAYFRNAEHDFACYDFDMPKDLAEILRAAIRKSAKPLLQIAADTGVAVASLSEFMSGADMRLKNASRLAAYFGLTLKRK